MSNRQLPRTTKSAAKKAAKRPKLPLTDKQLALQAIRQAPDEATLHEMIERIEIMAAIEKGIKAADEGRLIPHEEVKRRVKQWLSK
jgi:predicted transcriptional regulator